MNNESIQNDGYGVSRAMYIIYALFDNFIGILISGAYLAKLTTSIGISDSMTAILSSIITLSGVFQIFSILLSHKTPVKRWVVLMLFATSFLFSSLYAIPLLGFRGNLSIAFFFIIVAAYAMKSIASPILTNWFMALIPSAKRGMYSSTVVMVSAIGGTFFTLAASALIDAFEANGDLNSAFIALTTMILILIIGQLLPLMISKEKHEVAERRTNLLAPVRSLVSNRSYRTCITVFSLYSFAAGLTVPFLSTYQLNELGFSMSVIAVMDVIVNIIWIAALVFFGRFSFTHSKKSIISISYIFAILGFILILISTPVIGIVTFPLYRAINLVYASANCVSANNFLFEITPPEERTAALSISTITSGVSGFAATLIAAPIVDKIQAEGGLTVFGMRLYAQQVMSIATIFLTVLAALVWFIFAARHKENPEFIDI